MRNVEDQRERRTEEKFCDIPGNFEKQIIISNFKMFTIPI